MSNTKAATAGGRAAIAAQNAAYQASLKAPPPSGPKIYAFPAAQPVSPYAWSKELNDAALQGWKIYTLVKGGISGNQQLMVPARWTEMLGDGVVAQYPASATDWNWVAGVLADRVKNANVGVLGAGFDKVVPYIGLAIFALVAGPMVSQLFTAATGAAAGSAAGATASTTAASTATPAELLATGGGYSVAPVIATPTASTAFITAADSSISFTAANAAVAPGLISSITTTALTGGDIVATSLVNAGVTASSLAVVAPTLASSVAAASFSAASTPSLATALDVLAQPSTGIMTPDASTTAAKQAALNPTPAPATTSPSLVTQAQNLLTTMPVDASTVATAIKTVQQYNQGQAAVRQANAQAAASQQQAAAQQAALAAQAATANAPASNPLTSLSPGVILSLLAAGAAFLLS